MNRLFAFAASALLAVPGLGTAQQPGAAADTTVRLDAIVAVVGDQPITRYELKERVQAALQDMVQRKLPTPDSDSAMRALQKDMLNQLVEEELILQKAKELKVEVPESEVAGAVDKNIKEVRGRYQTEAEFRAALVGAGIGTPEEYRRFLTEQYRRSRLTTLTMQKLRQDNKLVPVNVTAAEVEAQFQRTKGFLPKRPPSVTFRQIVIAPAATPVAREAARVRAESVLVQIKRGADFDAMAKRESMDEQTKRIGGDMGSLRRGDYRPEIERWLFGDQTMRGLPPGQLSAVIESPLGFHIIRVDKAQSAEVKWHQIIIIPKVDSSDVVRTRLIADSVAARWKAGTPFDTLAKRYHDYAHNEETSLLTPFEREKLPPSYQTAFTGKKANDIVVFTIPGNTPEIPKFVVAQLVTVDEGGDLTLPEIRDRIRDELAQAGAVRRLIDTLKKQTYVYMRPDPNP
jgi:peptidyl-prolyl cis-trans isomerase SurA